MLLTKKKFYKIKESRNQTRKKYNKKKRKKRKRRNGKSFRKKRKPLNIKNKSIRKRRRRNKIKKHLKKQKGGALTYIYIPVPTQFKSGGVSFVLKKFNVKDKNMNEIIETLKSYESVTEVDESQFKTKKTNNDELYAIIYEELDTQIRRDNDSLPKDVLERLKTAMACGNNEELECEGKSQTPDWPSHFFDSDAPAAAAAESKTPAAPDKQGAADKQADVTEKQEPEAAPAPAPAPGETAESNTLKKRKAHFSNCEKNTDCKEPTPICDIDNKVCKGEERFDKREPPDAAAASTTTAAPAAALGGESKTCLLYTSPSPRD